MTARSPRRGSSSVNALPPAHLFIAAQHQIATLASEAVDNTLSTVAKVGEQANSAIDAVERLAASTTDTTVDTLNKAVTTVNADEVVNAASKASQSPSWLKPWTDFLEQILGKIQTLLEGAGIPYSYGWAIILLVFFVKTLTFPLTKQQVESSLKMQRLKPLITDIKERYDRNPDIIDRETQVLYEEYDINPSAGLFPSLATIPIILGLFYTLRNVAGEGLLDDQGFFFIPTLGGPTTFADRQAGSGLAWLWPFVDGAPPIGWDKALRYLALPVSVVIAQILSSTILAPKNEENEYEDDQEPILFYLQNFNETDPLAKGFPTENPEEEEVKEKAEETSKRVGKVLSFALPLLVGYFSLNVPSGLALYYLSNTLISSAQQIYLRNLGGIELEEIDVGEIPPGYGIRTGEFVPMDDGDLKPEDVKKSPFLDEIKEGNEDAWPLYDKMYLHDYDLFRQEPVFSWNENIELSEFSKEIEDLGPPPEEDLMNQELSDVISDGSVPSDFDDYFQDPDIR